MPRTRMPAISWDFATAYDLFVSLHVLHRPDQFGLRPSWAAGVRSRLPAEQREFFEKAQSFLPVPLRWLYLLPAGSRHALDAITALAHLPAAERLPALSHTSPHTPEDPPELITTLRNLSLRHSWNPAELEVIRTEYQRKGFSFNQPTLINLCQAWARPAEFGERYLDCLRSYYQLYFAEEEQRIIPAIEEGLRRARQLATHLSVPDLLDQLSHGVRFSELAQFDQLTLAPSYWSTPLLFFSFVQPRHLLVIFGCRSATQHLTPGETIPPGLTEVLKAIADPSRLAILRYLAETPLTPSELARRLRLRPPTVTHHLTALRLAGLVEITLLPGGERRYALRAEALRQAIADLDEYLHTALLPASPSDSSLP
jgi:DNA-binding transcriptional ArsR family regulator